MPCKIRTDPNWTPNNYEISFNPNKIPTNIKTENNSSLQKRLQKLLPTSKKIHIKLQTEQLTEHNDFKIHTQLKIANKEVKFL